MAILHGSWIPEGYLFIWGEAWRRVPVVEFSEPIVSLHPFAMSPVELAEFLTTLPISGAPETLPEQSHLAVLPSFVTDTTAIPQYSTASEVEAGEPEESQALLYLHPWRVEGFRLAPLEAVTFLRSLPLAFTPETFVGGGLRFWSHVARWSLDLLARSKFLPGIKRREDGSTLAHWQPLLDSATDYSRLERFAKQMPSACWAYPVDVVEDEGQDINPDALSLPRLPSVSPRPLIQGFLTGVIDAQVRAVMGKHPQAVVQALRREKAIALDTWLEALGSESAVVQAEPTVLERLEAAATTWTAPLQNYAAGHGAFRTCFYLHPPMEGRSDWNLEYFLQAVDDPDLLVGAATVWQNPVARLAYLDRTIDHPQETLLAGLGLASRLYPLLEPSLQEQRPQSCRLTALQVYEFIKATAWRLQDSGFGVVLPAGLVNQDGWASRLGLKIRAETPTLSKSQRLGLQSLLSFKWELSIGGQNISKAEFDRLVALNSPLVEINGEWVELRPQDIRAAQAFFTARKDQMSLSLEDALRISTGDTQLIEKLPVVSFEASGALEELISSLTTGNQNIEAVTAPASFRGELRPYQGRGVGWLAFLERWGLGACLADDMGLGKTIQFIAFLLHLQEQNALEHPTLLVCPTSVLGNWEREVKKFGPTLRVMLHHGDKRAKGKAFAKAVKDKDLVITSYALVYRDSEELQGIAWQGVVLDEAQNIKNPEAKQSQMVRQLQAQFRIALTGTPVENRLSELWSILDFLNPGYLGPRNFFHRRFAVPIERYGDTASLQTLRSLVQPFILRRLKTDRTIIQDLPEKQEMTVFCGLSPEQAALYQKTVDQSLVEIESAEGLQRHGMILALLVKLKQICNHPALLKSESAKKKSDSDLAFRNQSGKLQRLEEMLDEALAEGDRALLFTQFAEWGKLLKAHLERQFGKEVLFLYGSTSQKQREAMVDRFQHDPQAPRLFILSLKAGGVGLNLTRANHVFHFDRWWNPAVENQATDRVFRIGQTRNVQVHKFVCTGTLEEKIHDLIESKKALAEQVVGAGENWLTELDTNQLRNLLLLDRTTVIDDE